MSNRNISFRAWHSKQNKWLHDKSWGGCHILGETILLGEWCRVLIEELNDIVVEQHTGLHDKDKSPIFEGDIVLYDKQHWEIVFKIAAFWLKRAGREVPLMNLVTFQGHGIDNPVVVGNIHEGAPPEST